MVSTSPVPPSAARLGRAVIAVALSAALLAGCTQHATAPSEPPTSTPLPSASTQSSPESLGAADQIKVVAQAEAFLRALVKPHSSRDAWWAAVEPYLTPIAAKTLESLQPTSVGFARVSGSGHLIAETDQDRAAQARSVAVPTDAGLFSVQVTDPTAERRINNFGPVAGATAPATTVTTAAKDPETPAADDETLKRFAADFMRAFAKPAAGVSTREWWERIATMLTDDAIDTYADITPAAVPVRRVTGPIKIESLDDSEDIRAVTVGTDAGTYRLIIQPPTAGVSDRPLVIEIQEP